MRLSDAWLPPCGTTLPYIPGAMNLVTRDMERSILRYSPLLWSDATTPRTDKPVRFRPCTKHIERMNNRGTFEAVTVGYIFRPC